MRADTAALTGVAVNGEEPLAQLEAGIDDHLGRLDRVLAEAGDRGVRIEDGRLVRWPASVVLITWRTR